MLIRLGTAADWASESDHLHSGKFKNRREFQKELPVPLGTEWRDAVLLHRV
jgi:hypothetical protein